MHATHVLAAALTGQYATGYAATGYRAYPTQYVEKVLYQWVPVLSPGEYYGGLVGGAVRDQAAKAAQEQADAALAQRVSELAQQVKALTEAMSGNQPPAPAPSPAPTPEPPPAPTPQPPPSPYATDDRPPPKVWEVMLGRCLKCHGKTSKTPFVDPTGGALPVDGLMLGLIRQDVEYGFMPPDGGPLTNDEFAPFKSWADDRADDVREALKTARKGK